MNRAARERLLLVAAFAAPLALALALRALGSGVRPGPAMAFADEDMYDMPEPAPVATVRTFTPEELAAAAFAASKRTEPVGEAPLVYPKAAPVEAASAAAAPVDPGPAISVNSIMAGRGGAMATVNGKLRRVGDEVAPGWKITAIDAGAGTVTVLHADGREIVASRAGR